MAIRNSKVANIENQGTGIIRTESVVRIAANIQHG